MYINQSEPSFVRAPIFLNPSKITRFKDLKNYSDKVVKYTLDCGNSWNYIYLGKPIYETQANEIILKGFVAFLPKTEWKNRQIDFEQIITQKTFKDKNFDPCHHGITTFWFETVKFEEFEDIEFSNIGKLTSDHESYVCAINIDLPIARAPLTIVRSDNSNVFLDISIVFNEVFKAIEPNYPKPNKIDENGTATWSVSTQSDKTIKIKTKDNLDQKVHMIWWESLRNTDLIPLDTSKSACVKREDLSNFLSQALTKRGVKYSEQKAFITYWEEVLVKNNCNSPYLLIDLANLDQIEKLLPNMKVDSTTDFEIHRLYFRFCPSDSLNGLSAQEYLDRISQTEISSNAVIDLGGEIIKENGEGVDLKDLNPSFNQAFIEEYIKA